MDRMITNAIQGKGYPLVLNTLQGAAGSFGIYLSFVYFSDADLFQAIAGLSVAISAVVILFIISVFLVRPDEGMRGRAVVRFSDAIIGEGRLATVQYTIQWMGFQAFVISYGRFSYGSDIAYVYALLMVFVCGSIAALTVPFLGVPGISDED